MAAARLSAASSLASRAPHVRANALLLALAPPLRSRRDDFSPINAGRLPVIDADSVLYALAFLAGLLADRPGRSERGPAQRLREPLRRLRLWRTFMVGTAGLLAYRVGHTRAVAAQGGARGRPGVGLARRPAGGVLRRLERRRRPAARRRRLACPRPYSASSSPPSSSTTTAGSDFPQHPLTRDSPRRAPRCCWQGSFSSCARYRNKARLSGRSAAAATTTSATAAA